MELQRVAMMMQEVPVYVQHIFCTINICRLKRSPAVHCVYQQLRLIEGVCEVSPGRTFDTLLGFFFGGNSRNYCMTAIGTADIPFGADRVDLQYMIFFTKTINKYQQVFVFFLSLLPRSFRIAAWHRFSNGDPTGRPRTRAPRLQ